MKKTISLTAALIFSLNLAAAQTTSAAAQTTSAPAQTTENNEAQTTADKEVEEAQETSEVKTKYTMEELKELLVNNNTDLRTAKEEYAKSILDYKDAKAGMGPKIEFQASGTYMTNPPIDSIVLNVDDVLNSIQWPSGYSAAKTGQYITLYEGMENTFYTFQLSLEQPIFTWGKLYNAVGVYDKLSKVKKIQMDSKQKELFTELDARLSSLTYLQQIRELLTEEKTYTDRMVVVAEKAEKNGMLTHQEYVDSKIQAKELDIAAEGVDEQIQKLLFDIQKLTGLQSFNLETTDSIQEDPALLSIMETPVEQLEEKALAEDQDSLQMIALLKQIRETALKIQKNSVYWKPDFAIEASAGYGGSRFPLLEPNWLRKDDYTLNLSIGMKTTVWDGGKKLNAITRAQSELNDALISEDAAKQTIRKTLQEQYNTAQVCTLRIEYQDLKIESCQSKIKQQQTIFDSGYGSETDLLKAKIDLCNAKIEKLKQTLTRCISLSTIKHLTSK